MWREITRRIGRYDSAVLTFADDGGYPFSLRCRPTPEEATQTLRLALPAGLAPTSGKASLLWHTHDEHLANQWSLLVRGELLRDERGWLLRPTQVVPGIEQSPLAMYRFVRDSRRKAAAYLAARNLPRPSIPWDELEAVKRKARQG